jgi:hypothetical protein
VAARTLTNILLDPSTLIYLKLWSDQSKHHDCQSIHFSSTNSVSASIGCIYFFSSPTTLHSVPPLALWSDQLFIQLLKQNFKLQGKSAAATTKSNPYFNRRTLNMTDEGRRCRDTILAKRRQSRKEKKSCQNVKGSNDAQSHLHEKCDEESEDEESMYVLCIVTSFMINSQHTM